MREGTLSVIIPVYGVEKYIDTCIASVLGQTYRNLEILIVDDGSPDGSAMSCDRAALADPRVIVLHKTNGGLSDARNAGLQAAQGEYTAFVDSDDYIDENMYRVMIDALIRNHAEIAACGRYVFEDAQKTPLRMHALSAPKLYDPVCALKELLKGGEIEESACDKVYKSVLFDGIRFPLHEINEDIVVNLGILAKSPRVAHVGTAFYHYRFVPDGISKSNYNEKKHIVVTRIQTIGEYIRTNYPEIKRELHIYQARYAFTSLISIVKSDRAIVDYKEDYQFYLKTLRGNLPAFLSASANVASKKNKIIAILLCLEWYSAALRIKKLLVKPE